MRKVLLYSIIILFIVIVLKYSLSSYKIEYNVSGFNIKETYKNKRFYFEIKDKDKIYNFDIYANRKITKTLMFQLCLTTLK